MMILAVVAQVALAAAWVINVPSAAAVSARCPWQVSTVASGLGSLENLAFDGAGAMLLSRMDNGSGQIDRRYPDGRESVLVANVSSPGSIVVDGSGAYFTAGNSFASGALGRTDGTINHVDLAGGASTVVARGLTMPNGMARLPDGSFVVSRNLGLSTGLTRVSADGRSSTPFAQQLSMTNGVAYDPKRKAVITSLDLNPVATLALIEVADPDRIHRINLGLFGLVGYPDDLTVGPDGAVYLAMDGGSIVRVDPDHNSSCVLASGLIGSTSVRFGSGAGWDPQSIYSTDLSGGVHKLSPVKLPR